MTLAAKPVPTSPPSGPLNGSRGVSYGPGAVSGETGPVGAINQQSLVRSERDSHEGQDFEFGGRGRHSRTSVRLASPVVFESASSFAATVAQFQAGEKAAAAERLHGRKQIVRYAQGTQAYQDAAFYGGGHYVPLGSKLSLYR